jgi:hypothetical protein
MMRNRFAPHIDFSDLDGLLGNILPSNIDMVIERHGYFLIGEWKKPNEKISKGQEILLKALARIPKFTVLIISGDTTDKMVVHKFWKIQRQGSAVLRGEGFFEFRDYLVDWYLMADADF